MRPEYRRLFGKRNSGCLNGPNCVLEGAQMASLRSQLILKCLILVALTCGSLFGLWGLHLKSQRPSSNTYVVQQLDVELGNIMYADEDGMYDVWYFGLELSNGHSTVFIALKRPLAAYADLENLRVGDRVEILTDLSKMEPGPFDAYWAEDVDIRVHYASVFTRVWGAMTRFFTRAWVLHANVEGVNHGWRMAD